jgi:hypothetical protein
MDGDKSSLLAHFNMLENYLVHAILGHSTTQLGKTS